MKIKLFTSIRNCILLLKQIIGMIKNYLKIILISNDIRILKRLKLLRKDDRNRFKFFNRKENEENQFILSNFLRILS